MKRKKQKILHVITKGNWGGAQRYVFDLATRLPSTQFQSVVVHGEGSLLPEKLATAGIRTIRINSLVRDINIFKEFQSLRELIRIFKEEEPDIVHLNSSKIGGLGAVAARFVGVPKIIFTCHGLAWNEERAFPSKILIALSYWFMVQLCHHTIAVSHETRRQVLTLPFISRDKITVIHNGIDHITFEEKHAARSKIGGGSEKMWIGTIGELHKNKGFDILIDAFAMLEPEQQNVGLYIIGEGEERKTLEKRIAEKGLGNRVKLLGFIPQASITLKAFDIFVMSSRNENLPYVLLEAGLAQLPVIASRVGGIPEVITHMETGLLFTRGNANELARGLSLLMKDTALVAQVSHGIRKEVEDKYTVTHMVDSTIAVYNRKHENSSRT